MSHISALLLLFFSPLALQTAEKTYHFNNTTIETGHCPSNTFIRILQQEKVMYYNCGGDGVGYKSIDTLNTNSNSGLDFIYTYQMEEYTVLGMLFYTGSKTAYYANKDLLYITSPDTHAGINAHDVKDYLLKDIDKDGRPDIITNVISSRNKLKPIQGLSDTITYKQLLELKKLALNEVGIR